MTTEDETGRSAKSVPASVYTEEYYLTGVTGHEDFVASQGEWLLPRFAQIAMLGDVHEGERVLDVGCGRGEMVFDAARKGAHAYGVDYAHAALRIAHRALCERWSSIAGLAMLMAANGKALPFASNTFDTVYLLEVAEHLYPYELAEVLREIRRILKPGGKLIVHTAPNKLHADFGHPYQKFVAGLLYPLAWLLWKRDIRIKDDPRGECSRIMHVNEQTVGTLKRALVEAGFITNVWPGEIPPANGRLDRWLWRSLIFLWPLSAMPHIHELVSIEIWAVAYKI